MRADCRHLVTHTYSSGRVVEKCALFWAPAAPCACPDACERFAVRVEPVEPASEIDLRDRPGAVIDLRQLSSVLADA
jgi:hypothetical protein